jgi:polyhydroxybutyrate depolymerase
VKLFFLPVIVIAAAITGRAADAPAPREWTVDGVVREALVYTPANAKTVPAPVVFVFHGHGGNMNHTVRTFSIHTRWPEAIVVYPQGLKTPGRLTDPEGKKPGWQHTVGAQGDRDLKFFDAMLASLQKDYKVDDKRIYSTGHSNGGGFTYLLWAARGDKFTAFAPSAAACTFLTKLKPKPVLHLAGTNDPLVKFAWQKTTIDGLLKPNQCDEGKPWDGAKLCTLYPSPIGAPVVTFIHPGAHNFHQDEPDAIVKFFKEQTK